MLIRIEAESRRGLRIIDEIPDIPLCKIEGYNGIGKTTAIKLLSLCAGGQPFEGNNQDWRSFREQLSGARVSVTELHDARSIEWSLEPGQWPDRPEPLGDLIGQVRVNGRTANQSDIRALLSVHHINAAETPLTVLAKRVDKARHNLADWLNQPGAKRQQEVDFAIDGVQKLIMQCVPSQLQTEATAAEEASKLTEDIDKRLGDLRRKTDLLDQASGVLDRLEQVRGQGSEMDEKLNRLKVELEDLELRSQRLDEQITQASSRQHLNEQAEHKFELARNNLVRQDKALREVTAELERLTAAADVEPDEKIIAEKQKELGGRLNELLEQMPQIHATPMLVALLVDLADRLADAEQHELGQTTLLDGGEGREGWSVSALRAACRKQAEKLQERTPSGDALALAAEIEQVRARLDAVFQASQKLAEVQQANASFLRAEKRLRETSEALPAQAARTVEDLIRTRKELDQQSRTVQAAYARHQHARELLGGGMTEEALAAELLRLCKQAGVDAARIRGRRERARSELDELTRRHAQALQSVDRTRRVLHERSRQVSEVVDAISNSDGCRWLRESIPEVQSINSRGVLEQARDLERLTSLLEKARNRLRDQFTAVQGVGAALNRLHSDLGRPQAEIESPTPWDRAARLWLAGEVGSWFNDPVIRTSLFPGAGNLWLDWRDMRVHWIADGDEESRPLSGFSSGQQAFAYTHAQLAQLEREEQRAANRLIALDEFSAYLDASKMYDLAVYLEERGQRQIYDQVVVILPLETLPPTSGGDAAVQAQVKELRQRGYIAEVFTA
ncbi:hypothetical protein [Micromonospora sp. NPDC049171]|uniref:hypothetical protein n=1 Tax=Micromonospora sp. NPDC049171 TaxID=3155770 RepID=UPI0033FE9A44